MARRPPHARTPALTALAVAGLPYQVHEYEHDPRSAVGFGLEAAAKLGVPAERLFKTLMCEVDETWACAIVPVAGILNLKALAQALGGKRAELAQPVAAARATGYVVGGISPLGQKSAHRTVLDDSAMAYDTILVSGGQRGLSLEVTPADLVTLTRAILAPIGRQGGPVRRPMDSPAEGSPR